MPRNLVAGALALFLCGATAGAAIFPDQIGPYQKSAPKTVGIPDRALYDEFGLEESESADYTSPDKQRFSASGWRLRDSTGALALFQFRRPPGAGTADFLPLAVKTSDGVIFAFGNYVFQFTGNYPDPAALTSFYRGLAKLENSPLPGLSTYLPSEGLVRNSERYILGPVSLQRFEPAIPPSTAAFHLGAEAQLGKYNTSKGLLTLSIFYYPTPTMARDQAASFEKIAGAVVKRTGPLVAVTIAPPDRDAAERILGKINYRAAVTSDAKPPGYEIKGFARSIVSMLMLAAIISGLALLGGVGFGVYRVMSRKMWQKQDSTAMIVLGLEESKPTNPSQE